ncbi:LysR family transcriptional regulator, partial [Citrobacter sp. wls718]|uniref:LysR family transcriptional regulator n=1 Tax=Citrobacter sp. wls718 TaxID=2576418 RepID=UPI0010C955E2
MKFNLKPFELNVIRILAETRSISISADKTKISQANLSRMLTSLEDKIGAKIFDRGTRPLTLTRFGNELLPYIISSLEKNQEITGDAANLL